MASRSSRNRTPVPPPQQGPSKGSKAEARRSSPASPTRISRMQEKKELQTLNDRLACYIERNRQLESENSRLVIEAKSIQETRTSEITNIKSLMNAEIEHLRNALDKEAKGRARVELENHRLEDQRKDLASKLAKATKDLDKAEADAASYRNRLNDMTAKYSQVQGDQKKLSGQVKDLNAQLAAATRQLDEKSRQLDEELLVRVGVENQLQSAQEALSLERQVNSQALSESKITTIEYSELDSGNAQHLDDRYKQSLREIREKYEDDFRRHKEELQKLYGDQIKGLEDEIEQKQNLADNYYNDLKNMQAEIEKLRKSVDRLERRNKESENRVVDLENTLQNERQVHSNVLSDLRKEMADHMAEYQYLLDTKIALDVEISAYREMLEAEEHRLQYNPGVSSGLTNGDQVDSATPRSRGNRRKRTYRETFSSVNVFNTVHSACRGNIEIEECDAEGKFVRIRNKSDKEMALGGWVVVRKADNVTITFKLHRSIKLEAGGTITIWSSDSKETHNPPHTLVMNKQKWLTGKEMETIVLNANEDEEAIVLQKKEEDNRFSESVRDYADLSSSRVGGANNSENCRIM